MDTIEVVEPGLLTTVQDRGRYGYLRYGVPVSGAMDYFALRVANLLVGTPQEEACLEITFVGPRLRFLKDTTIALAGADLSPIVDGVPIPMWQSVWVQQGSLLSFGTTRGGVRAYLAVAGGLDVPRVMGSKSTYLKAAIGGIEGRALRAGDRLPTPDTAGQPINVSRRLPERGIPSYGHHHELRVIMGPQDDAFTEEGIQTFLGSQYAVTPQSDRMGYRLEGPEIQHKSGADIISDGIPLGAVQVPADGLPIVLLADRGTTGGYAKIATVITADIYKLAQAAPGDTVRFTKITLEEAYQALKEQDELLQQIEELSTATRRFRVTVNGQIYEVTAELEALSIEGQERPVFSTTLTHESERYDVEVWPLE